MRLLLDTHALLWWLIDDPQLSAAARSAIANLENDVLVSACTGYEIAYKQKRGRLPILPEILLDRVRQERIGTLPNTPSPRPRCPGLTATLGTGS